MTTDIDFQTKIDGTEYGSYLFVDKYSAEEVWLNANVRGGNTRITMTNEQAKDLIAALIRIVDAE